MGWGLPDMWQGLHTCAMAQRPTPLFGLPETPGDPAALERAAQTTIDALRTQGAIEAWHELDTVIVLELARAVAESKGIAKSQMFSALLVARSRLPEPVVATVEAEALEYEGQRAIEFFRAHSADLENEADTA